MPPTYNYLDLMPSSSITSYVPTIIEPVVHPRAKEAARRGMTVEQLLELEKKNALGSGVVFEDTGSDALNYYKATAGNDPEINYRELARRTEGELKIKEEAVKAADAIVGLAMPSTYINTALDWNEKEKMPDWASTMVDLALPTVGSIASKFGKRILPRISKELSLRKLTGNLNTNINKTSNKTLLEYIQDLQGARLTDVLSDPNNLIHYDHDLSILGHYRTNPLRRLGSYVDRQFLKPGLPMLGSDKPWIWAEKGHPYGGEHYAFERSHLNPNRQKRIIVTTSDAQPVLTPESQEMRPISADSRLLPYINLTDKNVKLFQTDPITGLYDEIKFLGPNLTSQVSGKFYPLIDLTQIPSTEEYLKRLKIAVPTRIKFMLENPVTFTDPHVSYTSFESQIERASARNQFPMEDLSKVEIGVTYTPTSDMEYGKSVGSYWGDKLRGEYGKGIRLYFNKNDKLPINLITKNHEFNHYTGNSPDEYIYQYLKDNGVVDWNHVGRYYKDADAGEIGTHLSELVDFSNGQPITTDLINNYMKYLRDQGFNMQYSIFNNIIDYDKFIDFINKFKFKQGGKMNYLEYFKKGGIHIKKSHEGQFTNYCRGKVTNECIARGKASKDPKVRKMATFAQNARTFKHQSGGRVYFSSKYDPIRLAKPIVLPTTDKTSKTTVVPTTVVYTPDTNFGGYYLPGYTTGTVLSSYIPTFTTDGMSTAMQGLQTLMVKYQLPVTMTSGYRKDDKTSNGSDSKHASGNAMDIVPMKGYSFEEIKSMIRNTPEIFDYMKANGIGLFDETSQETLAKTKGTGPHFHIGTDKVALKFFEV